MAFSYVEYQGDGTTTSYTFSFEGQDSGYIRESDIVALVDGASAPFTFTSSNTLEFDTAPADGSVIRIRRVMPKDLPYADFRRGNNFGQEAINNSFLQSLYTIQEALDGWFPENFRFLTTVSFADNVEFEGFDIRNAGTLYANDIVIGPTELSAQDIINEAYSWAQYPVDQLVPEGNGVDEYSAYHHRTKAEDAQALSEIAQGFSEDAQSASEASALDSEQWAVYPEDQLVPDGNGVDEYSSFHYNRKALAAQDASQSARDESQAARDTSIAAKDDSILARNASQLARDASQSARDDSQSARDDSQAARDKAQEWATAGEFVEVEPGVYSSLHYSERSNFYATEAAGSEEQAGISAQQASTSAQEADDHALESQNWANYPTDETVPGSSEYSSKHYAEKAEGWAQSLNFPSTVTHGGHYLRQKQDRSGFEYTPFPQNDNLIIDGRFELWNEGTEHLLGDGNYGSATMWLLKGTSGATKLERRELSDDTALAGRPNSVARIAAASTIVTSSAYTAFAHKVEDVKRFAGQTVTISFHAAGDSNMTEFAFEAEMLFGTTSNSITGIGVNKRTLTPNWQLFEFTFTFPEIPTGHNVAAPENTWIELNWWLSAGSDYNDRTDSLGSGFGSFWIADVRLEYGSQAHRDYWRPAVIDLYYAQRYFIECPHNGPNGSDRRGVTPTTNSSRFNIDFPVTMRSTPDLAVGDPQQGWHTYNGRVRIATTSANNIDTDFDTVLSEDASNRGVCLTKKSTTGSVWAFDFRWKADARL